MSNPNKKTLVTGGAGFIGSHLCEGLLDRGYEVVVLDNLLRGNKLPVSVLERVTFVEGDVCDAGLVSGLAEGCTSIYHLAAILGVDIVAERPIETMDTEVIGMRNVVTAAVENQATIVYASTSGIYGHLSTGQQVTEEMMVDPSTSYAMAKRYNEIYLAHVHEEHNLTCIALRYFNIYGPRQDDRMVIPRFIDQASSGEGITVFGKGNQTRDFTWVTDAVRATIDCGEQVTGFEIINVANQHESTILEVAEAVKKHLKSDSEIEFVPSPAKRTEYEVPRRFGSSFKLQELTGYVPETTLDEGLERIFAN